jgi:hypothetical protein
VLICMGASCAAVETTNSAVATEAQVTVDGETSYGYTRGSVPEVNRVNVPGFRQSDKEDSSDDSDDYIDCFDQDIACKKWARWGRCEAETDLMVEKCPVSCGVCVE